MRYWNIITYAESKSEITGEIQTRERIVNDEDYEKIRKALAAGAEFIDLGDKGIIRRSSIKEILPADREIAEYQKEQAVPLLSGAKKIENIKEYLERTHDEFYKKMGWK